MKHRLHVVLCYKSYSNNPGISHIGLGVTAMNCAKYLNAHGIGAQVLRATKEKDIEEFLTKHSSVTHFNVSALWVKTASLAKWADMFPHVQFSITCHSNVAFLQHEPEAITLIREAIDLEELSVNFHVCGNNERFVSFIEQAYGAQCTHLPNLYWLNKIHHFNSHVPWHGGVLRIGIFGAARSLKNFNTAAAAGIQMARELRSPTEIWINTHRQDNGDANVVYRAIVNSTRGVPNVVLKELPWAPWPQFRKIVGSMNILLQPSHSETFNNVTVDGLVEGVPSVVSNTIEWAPRRWMADVDDVNDVARVGMALLRDPRAAAEGYKSLVSRNNWAFEKWKEYLLGTGEEGTVRPLPLSNSIDRTDLVDEP